MVSGGVRDDRHHAFGRDVYFDSRRGGEQPMGLSTVGVGKLCGVCGDSLGAGAVVLSVESGIDIFVAGKPVWRTRPFDGLVLFYRVADGRSLFPFVFGGECVAVGVF